MKAYNTLYVQLLELGPNLPVVMEQLHLHFVHIVRRRFIDGDMTGVGDHQCGQGISGNLSAYSMYRILVWTHSHPIAVTACIAHTGALDARDARPPSRPVQHSPGPRHSQRATM